MPLHPFACQCGNRYEVLTTRIKADPDPTCPACGQAGVRGIGLPTVQSDTTFFRGAKYGGEQFDDYTRNAYTKPAEAAGVSTNGKVYQHGLARFPGDPMAWIDNKGDARRIIESRGWGSEDLGITARNDYEPKRKAIDERLVTEELHNRVAAGMIDPGDAEKKRDEVRDHITPDWKKSDA